MNKKFLSVVLFGALMAGSSVTFTGCIDNDEPAGIEELRTAKAALIKANEAYRLAEVEWQKAQAEMELVKVEQQKVLLEMDKLNLEIAKANSDYEIALLQAKKDSVAEDFKGKLFELQETTAKNEAAYLKALAELEAAKIYVTDSVFSNKLVAITKDLKKVSGKISTTMGDIADLNKKLLMFSSNAVAVGKEFIAGDIKSGQSKLANDSVTLAEFKKLAEDYSDDAVNAQIVDINKQIIEIDKKVAELKQEITANGANTTPIEQELSKQKVALEKKDQTIALNVPAAIESEFIEAFVVNKSINTALEDLAGNEWITEQGANIETKKVNVVNDVYSFKTAPVIEELQLGSVGLENKINENALLSAKVEEFAAAVEKQGIGLYKGAYELLTYVPAYNLPALSGNAEITEEDKAKVAAALEKVNTDLTTAETTYKADTTAFKAAYAAYLTAAKAYGIELQLNDDITVSLKEKWTAYEVKRTAYEQKMVEEGVAAKKVLYDDAVKEYDRVVKIVADKQKDNPNYVANQAEAAAIYNADQEVKKTKKTYEDALAKVPSTELTAAITALKAELTAYYPKRKALVGEVFKTTIAGFNEGKEFVISEKLASLDTEQFAILIKQGQSTVIGGYWETVAIDASSTENDGAAQTWIKASNKLYGTTMSGTISAALREAKTTIVPLNDVKKLLDTATVDEAEGSAVVYVVLQNAKNAFSTIDTWTSYAEALNKIATEKAALEAPIVAEIEKQAEALKNINEPLRDTIYEICKLDADQFTGKVKDIATSLGITTMNSVGEKQTLKALKESLEAIGGELEIDYIKYTYDENKNVLTPSTETIDNVSGIADAITDIENNIKYLNKYIAVKKDDLAAYDNGTYEIDDKIKAEYEAELANAQEALKGYQAAFDALTKAKDELIAAITE